MQSMIKTIPLEDPLGAAVVTLLVDEFSLPTVVSLYQKNRECYFCRVLRVKLWQEHWLLKIIVHQDHFDYSSSRPL